MKSRFDPPSIPPDDKGRRPRPSQARLAVLVIAVLALVAPAPPARAQTLRPILEFNFSNPGARSLGFGGAFVARADDATAAFANPAGLVQLVDPELSVEGRYRDPSAPDTTSNDAFPSSGTGSDLTALSFVSFVYPLKRWSFAAYGHQLGDVRSAGEESPRLTVVNLGLSAAFRATERLSLGLGLAGFGGDLSLDEDGSSTDTGGLILDDTDVAFIAGLLWNWSEQWSAGGFYRRGAELELPVAVPAVYGLGFSFRSPGGGLTVSWEWDRVEDANILGSPEYPLPERTVREGGSEVHLGVEYAWLQAKPVFALRFGAWKDHEYRIHGAGETISEGGGETHYAFGFGMVFQRFQLDLALDFSAPVDTGSISAIVYF